MFHRLIRFAAFCRPRRCWGCRSLLWSHPARPVRTLCTACEDVAAVIDADEIPF